MCVRAYECCEEERTSLFLAKHVLETGHSIDFEGTKTIAVIQHQGQRIIREALEIAKRPNCLNKRDDGIRLPLFNRWRDIDRRCVPSLLKILDNRLYVPVAL